MPYADAIADIDAALAAPPPSSGGDAPAPAVHPIIGEIDRALAGEKPADVKAESDRQSHYLASMAAGANTGLIAGTLGLPVDLATGVLNVVPRALGYEGITQPVGGSEWINHQLGRVGIGTEAIPATTTGERVAQETGRGIGAMLGPNMLAKGRALTGIAGAVAEPIQEALSAGSLPGNAGVGAGSGIVGQTAAEVVPEPYRPLAYEAGSLAGGVGTAALGAAGTGLVRGVPRAYNSIPPLRAGSREQAASAGAAERFRGAASDSDAAFSALDTQPREIVPGSTPTTAELSGDPGLLGAQRYREVQSPDFGREVLGQRAGNATARMDLLEGQAPRTASIEDTQNHLRGFLADIDRAGNRAVEAERQNAGRALNPALPRMQPEEQGALARGAVEAERAPQAAALAAGEQRAIGELGQATGQFGGQEAFGSAEERALAPASYGQGMREPLAAAYAAEQQRLRALREAIDPEGRMGMRPDPIKEATQTIEQLFPAESGAQLSGAERHLYDTAAGWGSLVPVERVFQLRANINGRLRGLAGSDPQEALRLGIFKQGVDDAIARAAADVHTGEQAGVIHQGLPGVGERVADIGPRIGSRVYTAAGRPMDVRYELADLAHQSAPVVSHDIEGSPNPAYPQELQPRDRSRAINAVQVRRLASELQPERLGASVSAGEGAPIVGPDNFVESGNGRMLALRQAYDAGLPSAARYRQFLADQGYDTSGMAMPVLIRRRVSELSPQERLAAVREANAPTVARMGAAEQAAVDARKLDRDLLSGFRGGNLASAENRPFVRDFMRNVPSPGEEGALATPEGALSLEGERRISNALLQRAYGDSRLVASLAEAGDEHVRTFGGALTDAAGEVARLRADVEAGLVPRQFDISKTLTEAARLVQGARARSVPLGDFVAQRDAFTPTTPLAESILRQAYGANLRSRLSRANFADYLQRYAQDARRQSAEPQLLGDVVTPERILASLGEQYGQSARSFGRDRSRRPMVYGESGGARGPEARGSGVASPGPGTAETGEASGVQAQGRATDRALTPLTPEARERFGEWNAGYRQMGQTFRGETPGTLHAVGKILQKGGAYDSYRLTDAETPWLFVNRGQTARDAVDRFLKAAPPEAHAALDDAFAFSLRRAAQNPDGTLDLGKYETWLKGHNAALSARPELAQRFNTAAQAQRRLNEVREAIAQHAKEHPLKPGWSDASLLGRYFKPGPEGAERMREFLRSASLRDAWEAVTDYAAYSFANAAVRNGEVNPRLADTWIRQHEQALSVVPGVKDRFTDATAAQRTLEGAIEAHEQARSTFTRSVAGAFIQDDPGRAVARVFSGASRQQKASLLMDLTRSSPSAREGLQRAAIDYIRTKFEGAAVPGSEVGGLMPKRFADFVEQNRDVLATLFPGRIANFDALVRDLERSSLVQNAKINKGGSDTAELTAGRHGEHGNDIGMATAAILAERAGEHVGHHVLGSLAGTVGAVGTVAGRILFGKAKEALRVREDALFDKMLLDPDFAKGVNQAHPAKPAKAREAIGATLRGRLIQQTLASAHSGSAQ